MVFTWFHLLVGVKVRWWFLCFPSLFWPSSLVHIVYTFKCTSFNFLNTNCFWLIKKKEFPIQRKEKKSTLERFKKDASSKFFLTGKIKCIKKRKVYIVYTKRPNNQKSLKAQKVAIVLYIDPSQSTKSITMDLAPLYNLTHTQSK